ncbi:adenylate kinase 8 [Caerostris extrusa]|uniref:Adenylate kinase 8 n=1 Tax=Caerostris extrusa TaxID=172846 RepID=A0AAV4Y9N6_CAEEX|nr:adenylate kinase 8 [Caerostris extrusa]
MKFLCSKHYVAKFDSSFTRTTPPFGPFRTGEVDEGPRVAQADCVKGLADGGLPQNQEAGVRPAQKPEELSGGVGHPVRGRAAGDGGLFGARGPHTGLACQELREEVPHRTPRRRREVYREVRNFSHQITKLTSDGVWCSMIEFVRTRQRPPEPYLPRVLLFGPYGSGCLEMARRLAKKFHLVEVDFRRELRSAALKDSPLKDKFYDIMRTYEPVPDELLVQVASERLLQEDCVKSRWIMYNFPDTKVQVELLVKAMEGFQVNRAVFLDATLETCLQRMEPRRWDPSTGEIYHLKLHPCTERKALNRLIQMPQDSEDSVRADHELYHTHCFDVKAFFKHQMQEDIAVEVDANSPEEAVFEMIQGAILKSAKMKMPQED